MSVASGGIPVILAGGSGERFLPLSRRNKPKQFLTLDDTGRSSRSIPNWSDSRE